MKILILGQPRSGKTNLSEKLNKLYDIEIIHTDIIRKKFGYHCPHKGFSTEIDIKNQNQFYQNLLEIIQNKNSWIIEGSAINPKDRDVFNADIVILLGRPGINYKQMFKESRKFDKDWTSKREDDYLLKLFKEYKIFETNWIKNNKDIFIDTTNYEKGLKAALLIIFQKYND